MDESVRLLKELVSIPSVTGSTCEAVEHLHVKCREQGMDAVIQNGALVINPEAKDLLLLGHIDTVAGGPEPRIEDGELWGRGSVDAKGPLCSAISALSELPELWDRVQLIAVPDEEGSSETAYEIREELDEMPVIILEPSGSEGITISYNGRMLLRVKAEAESGHSGHETPFAGEKLVSIFNRMNERSRPRILELSGSNGKAEMLIDIRYPPGERPVLPDKGDDIRIELIEDVNPYRSEKNSSLVRSFLRGIRKAGGRPVFKKKTGTSDMNVIGDKWDTPMIAYGPGDGRLDHTDEERIPIDEYLKSIDIMVNAINHFLKNR